MQGQALQGPAAANDATPVLHSPLFQRKFKYSLSTDGLGCSNRLQKVMATGQVGWGAAALAANQ